MKKPTEQEIRAMAFRLADDIETRAQSLIAGGMSRDKAIAKTIEDMAA